MIFKILICDETLSSLAPNFLNNYRCDTAKFSQDIIDYTFECKYNLYIFNMECFSVLKELRESGDDTPAIFIDEYYSFNNFKKAFSIGDAYILKPLYLEELEVRLKYFYKKVYNSRNDIIIYKNFYFHTITKQLFYDKRKIKLSPNELKLIELFFANTDKPISKDIIYEELKSNSDGSLRVYISKLKKIDLDIIYERSINSYTLKT